MPNDNCAILVGISRYRDSDAYPTLQGPLNDVARMNTWLTLETSEVLSDNVTPLTTPAELLALAADVHDKSKTWSPTRAKFSDTFNTLVVDDEIGTFRRRPGRLYLYFSGHGFSQGSDTNPRAALYAADAYKGIVPNLAGSLYAEAAQRGKFFNEIVLIMDCCRDVEDNVDYNPPEINKVEDDGSEKVRVMAIYAAPKRGKAQERELTVTDADAKPMVVGLLTNAWLLALKEAPASVSGTVPGAVLKQYLNMKWSQIYPVKTPPVPRIVLPEVGDIYFQSRRKLTEQRFALSATVADEFAFRLSSDSDELDAVATVRLGNSRLECRAKSGEWSVDVPLKSLAGGSSWEFTFKLANEPHTLKKSNDANENLKFTPGAQDVLQIA